jgi:hypothetical protein
MKKDRPPGKPSPNRRGPPGPLWLPSLSLFVPLSELMSELENCKFDKGGVWGILNARVHVIWDRV